MLGPVVDRCNLTALLEIRIGPGGSKRFHTSVEFAKNKILAKINLRTSVS